MAAPMTTPDFLELIRASGLVGEDTLARLGFDLPSDQSPARKNSWVPKYSPRFRRSKL